MLVVKTLLSGSKFAVFHTNIANPEPLAESFLFFEPQAMFYLQYPLELMGAGVAGYYVEAVPRRIGG